MLYLCQVLRKDEVLDRLEKLHEQDSANQEQVQHQVTETQDQLKSLDDTLALLNHHVGSRWIQADKVRLQAVSYRGTSKRFQAVKKNDLEKVLSSLFVEL